MFTPGHARLEANRAPNGMNDCRHGDEDDSGLFLGDLGRWVAEETFRSTLV
jgi:hypothetical protein